MKEFPFHYLSTIIDNYEKSLKNVASKYDLNFMESYVLKILYVDKECDTITLISKKYHLLKSLICMYTQTLQLKGFIKLSEINFDKKTVHFRTTQKAEPVCEELLEVEKSYIESTFSDISEKEANALISLLIKMGENSKVIKEEVLDNVTTQEY